MSVLSFDCKLRLDTTSVRQFLNSELERSTYANPTRIRITQHHKQSVQDLEIRVWTQTIPKSLV